MSSSRPFFFSLQGSVGSSSPIILVINKIDCDSSAYTDWFHEDDKLFCKHIFTCAVTGQGIENLETVIAEIVGLNKIPAGGRKWTVNKVC